jgi:hypothetical protein
MSELYEALVGIKAKVERYREHRSKLTESNTMSFCSLCGDNIL